MNIAVFSSGVNYGYQKGLFEGIHECASKYGHNVFVFTCNPANHQKEDYIEGEYNIFSLPNLKQYKGVIVVKDSIYYETARENLLNRIREANVPTVVLGGYEEGMVNIGIDEKKAMGEMVEHLISVHGAKKISYISGLFHGEKEFEKLEAYKEKLKENGIPFREEQVYYYKRLTSNAEQAINQLLGNDKNLSEDKNLSKDKWPDAIVCANDQIALEILFELKTRGIRVPEDIKLTGFGNHFEARNVSPEITSVEKPMYEIGYMACERIIHAMTCEEDKITMDVSPIYSQSCGCKDCYNLNDEEFRQTMIYNRGENIKRNILTKDIVADLTCLQNYDECIELLKWYVKQIRSDRFFLCLCGRKEMYEEDYFLRQNYVETEPTYFEGYSKYMYIPLIYDKGEFSSYNLYNGEDILPEQYMKELKGDLFVIAPIHFLKHCYGYCVFQNSTFGLESDLFFTWVINIGIALENIWKYLLSKATIAKLETMWVKDNLTDVYNRSGFFQYAPAFVESIRNDSKQLCILFCDIDGLKLVNDQYGHDEGDYYIRTVTDILKETFQNEKSMIMRYGGDEFVVLLEVESKMECKVKENQLKEAFIMCNQVCGKPYIVDASVGSVMASPDEDIKWELLLEEADQQMYIVKRKKKRHRA